MYMNLSKRNWISTMLVIVLLGFGLTALMSQLSQSQETNRIEAISKYGFDKTVDNLTKAIKSRGMMIVATIDHQNMLSMVGVKIKGAKTIEFGKPDMGKMVLTMSPEAGLEMPGKIYVFERKDGKTIVSYYKSNYAQYMPEFKNVDEMMAMMLSEIVSEVK